MANVIQLGETESARALQRMLTLKDKHKGNMNKVREIMGQQQYNLAENEFISRAGDPNRFVPETHSWRIWP